MPEMHLVDFSKLPPTKYSFCGPFSKLHKRLDENDNPLPHSLPINSLDSQCLIHDIAYKNFKDVKNRNEADRVLRDKAKKIKMDSTKSKSERFNAAAVEKIMNTKQRFGMGNK